VALLRWAAARLHGFAELGLVVTVGNDAALRAYERVGFEIMSTAWTVRLP
jgi:ribosomal protein S18 acetylase RimI-like enzyme